MPQSPPRVSFIILSYNQRKFIRDAVMAALAQRYPNLEIIVSDHGSTDGTVEEVNSTLEAYKGPHNVQFRTGKGKGILAHFYDAVDESTGTFIIAAAGDDVSLPDRTAKLVDAWLKTEFPAVHSGYHRIDESANIIETVKGGVKGDYDPGQYFFENGASHIPGSCAGYSRSLFEAIPLPDETIWAEDYYFSMMMGLRSQRAAVIDEPLVLYRMHSEAINNFAPANDVEIFENRAARFAAMVASVMELTLRYARGDDPIDPAWGKKADVDTRRLQHDAAFMRYRSEWLDSSFSQRLAALLRFRRMKEFRWLMPRLFGIAGLKALKSCRG